ncbi:MAG: hypothetical protein D6725_13055 [Planctomycetota bacterium]|nr:MAG: hypothetical protein D6725_13055 [Planctomycetota bacterium]
METLLSLPFLLIKWLVGLLLFVFWIWVLVDCLVNEPSQGNEKIAWAVVILLGNLLGALLYLVIRRPERIRRFGR